MLSPGCSAATLDRWEALRSGLLVLLVSAIVTITAQYAEKTQFNTFIHKKSLFNFINSLTR